MELTTDLWYLFPAAVTIATIAMASGVGGAIFFSPLFIIVLGLDAKIAIGTALITELFGFSSGLVAYVQSKLIDFRLGKDLLKFSIPAAILGTLVSGYIPSWLLKLVFSIGIIYIGFQIYWSWKKESKKEMKEGDTKAASGQEETVIVDNKGKIYRYVLCNKRGGRLFALLGGTFVGLISVGLGELMDYHLVSRCKVPTPVAVATSVFCVVITVLVASLGHFYEFFFNSEPGVAQQVTSIVLFTIPGVLLGGQLGPRLQRILPEHYLKIGLSTLFVIIGLMMLYILAARP